GDRRRAAGVDGGGDVATWRGHVDQRAVVGEAGARAGAGGGGHRDDVAAVGRVEAGGVGVAVAGGHHHGGATRYRAVDRALGGAAAGAAAAQAHVDHFGRI